MCVRINLQGVIEYCCRVLNRIPYLYCDLHGHSRRKNVFFYGCSQAASWNAADRLVPEDPAEFLVPKILNLISNHNTKYFCSVFAAAAAHFAANGAGVRPEPL